MVACTLNLFGVHNPGNSGHCFPIYIYTGHHISREIKVTWPQRRNCPAPLREIAVAYIAFTIIGQRCNAERCGVSIEKGLHLAGG